MTTRNRQIHNLFAFILPALGILMLLVVSSMAQAARPEVPPGKVLPVETFDYRDFGSGETTQRVYSVTNGDGVTQILEDIDRDAIPGQVMVTRSYWADTLRVRVQVIMFIPTETDLLMTQIESYDGIGTLQNTSEFDPPLSIRQSSMPLGAMQASAATRLFTPAGSPDAIEEGVTRWNVALGIEPNGELAGSLRILEQHNSNLRMLWLYPGIGPIKRVQSENGPIWNLISHSP